MAITSSIHGVSKLSPGAWVHFTAIGGTGMGALAALLKDSGFRVTGSDGPLYPPMSVFLMEEKKIPIHQAYRAENLKGSSWGFVQENPDLVIVGNAISRGHVEAALVEDLVAAGKTRRMSFAEGLAEFAIGENRSFVIVGTHGKTTTTSLMTWCFEVLGREPGFFIGGLPKNFGRGCRLSRSSVSNSESSRSNGGVFVSEGDEYDTAYWDKESKFLHYRPSWVLCTSIELDHVDIFKNVEAVEQAFVKLAERIKEGLVLIDDQSAPNVTSLQPFLSATRKRGLRVSRYGWQKDSDYCLLKCEAVPLPWDSSIVGSKLSVQVPDRRVVTFHSPMIGVHNALNVVGILAVLLESGELKEAEKIESLLKDFSGIKRRQEEVFSDSQLVVIDDFAHHPTAIKETLLALKARYRDSKMSVFFEPRSATSGRNALKKEFEEAFFEADAIFLTPPTKTNIPEAEKLDVEGIARTIEKKDPSKHVFIHSNVEELTRAFLEWRATQPGRRHIAAVMTNGPFGGIHKKIEEAYLAKKKILGQAAIEYILISAMVVGVIVGAMYPVLSTKMAEIQQDLGNRTTTVLRQDSLGIPLSWFQSGLSAADVNSAIDGAGESFATNPDAGGNVDNNPNDPNQGIDPGATRGDENKDPQVQAVNEKPDTQNNRSGNRGNFASSAKSSTRSADPNSETNQEKGSTFNDKRSNADGGNADSSSLNANDGKNAEKTQEGEGTTEDEGEDAESKRARKALASNQEEAGGTCGNMNFYTLIKIAIGIGIFLLAAAVVVTTKGQKGSK